MFDDDNDLWWWWWCWLWWRRAGLSKLVYIWVETLCGNTTRIIFGFWFWKSLPYLFQSSVLSDKVLELSRAVLGFQHLHSNPMMSLIFFTKDSVNDQGKIPPAPDEANTVVARQNVFKTLSNRLTGLAESWLDHWKVIPLALQRKIGWLDEETFAKTISNLKYSEYTWCSLSLGANQVHGQISPWNLVFTFYPNSKDCEILIINNFTLPNSPSPMVSSKISRFLGNSSFWSTCSVTLQRSLF